MFRRIAGEGLSQAQKFVEIGHYDFCPWANRYVYWLKQPIGWFLLAAIASAAIGALAVPQGWFVCGIVTAVTLLGIAWPSFSMRGLQGELCFSRRRCYELDSVVTTVTITNRWPWPVWGLMVDGGFDEEGNDDQCVPSSALARVQGWSQTSFEFPLRPQRRGIYPLRPPQISTGFPFGMWTVRRPVSVSEELIVWPRCADLKSLPLFDGDQHYSGGVYSDRAGSDGDLLTARHYRVGDSLRRIHWSHTARRDRLIVCDRQSACRKSVALFLNSAHFATETISDSQFLDWAVRVVASLTREFRDQGWETRCWLDGEWLVVDSSTRSIQRLFDKLARLQPGESDGSADDAIPLQSTGGLKVLVTSTPAWTALGDNATPTLLSTIRAIVLDDTDQLVTTSKLKPSVLDVTPRPWTRLDVMRDLHCRMTQSGERNGHDGRNVN